MLSKSEVFEFLLSFENGQFLIRIILSTYSCWFKDLFIEKVTKRSSKTLLCLVTFSMNKSLCKPKFRCGSDPNLQIIRCRWRSSSKQSWTKFCLKYVRHDESGFINDWTPTKFWSLCKRWRSNWQFDHNCCWTYSKVCISAYILS